MTIHESNIQYIYGALITALEYWKTGAKFSGPVFAVALLHDLEQLIKADQAGVNLLTEPDKVGTEKL